MKNVYKYILMFLSISSYIARLGSLLIQIKNKKIYTPDGLISEDEIAPSHEHEFEELLIESTIRLDT